MNEIIQSAPLNDILMPSHVSGYELLAGLALDMRFESNHTAGELWQQLDPGLWELTLSPWIVLQTVAYEKLENLLKDVSFREKLDFLVQTQKASLESKGWFHKNYPDSRLTQVAYFSMEYMLSEALPIYSGGLGNVAGDQLKAASDLGVPVVGVGLLYQQGYFRQVIDKEGAQQALYPFNNPGQLPVTPLRHPDGQWLRLKIEFPGYSVWFRSWQVKVGRVKLYLLDTNDMANPPIHRGITSELYGGGSEMRLKQEMLLGIGGWRLLQALGIEPQVCHLNEGHAAFAVLERASGFMQLHKLPFDVSLSITRAGNIFTTHTAVKAGFDRFSPFLMGQYLGDYAHHDLGISYDELMALGRSNPYETEESFNMAYLAIHGSGSVNGVSRLHKDVSRHILSPLFQHWPTEEVPVSHVTNGVHIPSWESRSAADLFNPSSRENGIDPGDHLQEWIYGLPDENLWQMRKKARMSLVEYSRNRLSRQLEASGSSKESAEKARQLFSPDILTLGFARRFASYKRPNLLLKDRERLLSILKNPDRPVQLIIAGKAHPADVEGQAMIQEWIKFIRQEDVRPHIMFLGDYDMQLTRRLVEGVDVWINNPRRPWEASGTSGMKILINGGLNLSELDGWWVEAYDPSVGWALGDGKEHKNEDETDNIEAEALYTILENEVVPKFYKRNENNLPVEWIALVRESMARLTPQYSATRAVKEYTENHYLKSSERYLDRTARYCALGKELFAWMKNLTEKWNGLAFGEMHVATKNDTHQFSIGVVLNGINPGDIRVELYAKAKNMATSIIVRMEAAGEADNHTVLYKAEAPASVPSEYYTARITPFHEGISVPLELNHILWQR